MPKSMKTVRMIGVLSSQAKKHRPIVEVPALHLKSAAYPPPPCQRSPCFDQVARLLIASAGLPLP